MALIVCIITTGAIGSVILRGQPMSDTESEIMSQLTSAIISIVSMYVGASIQRSRDE